MSQHKYWYTTAIGIDFIMTVMINYKKKLISSDLELTSPPSTEGSRVIVARQYFVSNSRG